MAKIFITGSTGYIGGDALHAIITAHPEYEISALVRSSDKGAKVAQVYPRVKLVYGDMEDLELLEREAKAADVVCNFANADDESAAQALLKGLEAHDPSKPGFLIHTSGAGCLLFEDMRAGTYGTVLREKIYNDLEGIKEVISLPDDAPHCGVDKLILEVGTRHADRVKTAIVCPPVIYGIGRGPDNKTSVQLPRLCRASLEKGVVPMVNEGKAYCGNVHIYDLSKLYLKLVEEAAAGGSTAEWSGKPAVWGEEGYYFCENGENIWGEVSQWVADEAKKQGLIESNEVKRLSADEADEWLGHRQVLWSANSRARAKRARQVLGWEPTSPSFKDDVKSVLEIEALKLGLKTGHAAEAAGGQ